MTDTPERTTTNDHCGPGEDAGHAGYPSEGALAEADLLLRLGSRMSDLHRPFAAFRCLDRAEDICISLAGTDAPPSEADIALEHCRAMRAECLLGMVEDVPEEHRPLFAIAGSSYLNTAVEDLIGMGELGSIERYCGWLKVSELYKRAYPISQKEIDRLNRTSVPDGYPAWCRDNRMHLNIVDAVPDVCSCDGIELDLDEEHMWLLEDVMGTFDHCRRLLHRAAGDPSEVAGFGREDVETAADCCVRLLTLLDKTAGLVAYMFPYPGTEEHPMFRDVAAFFVGSPNPYLGSMHPIWSDLSPDGPSGIASGRARVLGSIVRGTLRVQYGTEGDRDAVSPTEVVRCAEMLMRDVREVLLNLQLAVGYSRNHRPGPAIADVRSDNRMPHTLYAGPDTFSRCQ